MGKVDFYLLLLLGFVAFLNLVHFYVNNWVKKVQLYCMDLIPFVVSSLCVIWISDLISR